jgi:ASC-1-like (ASCH) protein
MAEKLANTLPSRDYKLGTKGEGLQAVYDKADEKDHGVLAIQVKVVAK